MSRTEWVAVILLLAVAGVIAWFVLRKAKAPEEEVPPEGVIPAPEKAVVLLAKAEGIVETEAVGVILLASAEGTVSVALEDEEIVKELYLLDSFSTDVNILQELYLLASHDTGITPYFPEVIKLDSREATIVTDITGIYLLATHEVPVEVLA